MRSKNGIILISILAISFLLFFGGSFIQERVSSYKISRLEPTMNNFNSIEDGTYSGEYIGELMAAEVTVMIKKHTIISITLDSHKTGRGSAAEKIVNEVIKQQSLEVDTISGATQSSKVILKAIENALISSNVKSEDE